MKLRYGTPEEAGTIPKRVDVIKNLCARWVEQKAFPAIVALVAHKGIIVLHEAFGKQGPEPDSPPVEIDSIFPLASMTKIVTAAVAMSLVEDGLLGLHLSLCHYIPELTGENKDKIRISHLLTHTSGFNDESLGNHVDWKAIMDNELAGDIKKAKEAAPNEFIQHPFITRTLSLGYDAPLATMPGTEMYYMDHNYNLLCEVIVRVSGKSLYENAKERILDPLGMKDSYYETPDSVRNRIVGRPSDFHGLNGWTTGLKFHWVVMGLSQPRWIWQYSGKCALMVVFMTINVYYVVNPFRR